MASVRKREWTHNGVTKSTWVCTYVDQKGKSRLKTFEKKKDADAFRGHVETEIRQGIHTPEAEAITVDRALDLWLESCAQRVAVGDKFRRSTLENFKQATRTHVRPQLGKMRVTELSGPILQAWLNELAMGPENPLGKSTVTRAAACLGLALTDAQTRGKITHNVMREVRLRMPGRQPEKKLVPTKEDIRALLDGGRDFMRPVLFLAIFTGMRKGEMRALTWDNVDFEKEVVRVRVGADAWRGIDKPKSAAGIRDVPMAPPLIKVLKEWKLARRPSKLNLVFPSPMDGGVRSNTSIDHSWCRMQSRLGWGSVSHSDRRGTTHTSSKYHFHSLRHVAASLWIEAGLPPKRIQELMGHTSIQMTFDLYGHLFRDDEMLREAMKKIGNALVS